MAACSLGRLPAVVAEEEHEGGVGEAKRLQLAEHHAHVAVELRDRREVAAPQRARLRRDQKGWRDAVRREE